MSEDNKGKREGFRDGIRQGMGVLSAFKEAIEETISEARERGDLRPERAKEVMRDALDKAQAAAGQARERFDFVTQADFDRLRERVAHLAARVAELDGQSEPEFSSGSEDEGDGAETEADSGEAPTEAPRESTGGAGPA